MKSWKMLAISMVMGLLINGSAHAASLQLAPSVDNTINISSTNIGIEAGANELVSQTTNLLFDYRVPVLAFNNAKDLSKATINSVKLGMYVSAILSDDYTGNVPDTYNHLFRISGVPRDLSDVNSPNALFSKLTFKHLGSVKAVENSWSEWNISSGTTLEDINGPSYYAVLALSTDTPVTDLNILYDEAVNKIPYQIYRTEFSASELANGNSPYMAVNYTEQPVPEPSTMIFGLMGIAGALGLKRKKASC